MKRRLMTFLATTVIATPLAIGSPSGNVNAATEVPWAQRPVTVSSGFRLVQGTMSEPQAVVSASGRWVAFTSNLPLTDDDHDNVLDNDRSADVDLFLRDRWTDTTLRIAHGFLSQLTMSADGNLIAAVSGATDTAPSQLWVYRRDTGERTTIAAPGAPNPRFLGINNDGYFLISGFGIADQYGYVASPSARTGRLLKDGSVTTLTYAASGSKNVVATNPSMKYLVTVTPKWLPDGTLTQVVSRVDATNGTTITAAPELTKYLIQLPERSTVEVQSLVISRNGRYIALTLNITEDRGEQGVGKHWLTRLWDASTGLWYASAPCDSDKCYEHQGGDIYNFDVRAVLDDGRVILVHEPYFSLGIRDFRKRGEIGVELSTTYAGVHDEGQRLAFPNPTPMVATDINRVLYCTTGALSAFDTNNTFDCYLKQI